MLIRSCLMVLSAVALAGCGKPPPPTQDAPAAREAENPWAKAAATLRKDTDPATCRRVLNDLSAAAFAPGGTPLPSLNDGDRQSLQAALGLTDVEGKEIAAARYTHLDAAHLAECFYLRDVAATLDATGSPVPVQAERALALVCRQVQRVPLGTVQFLSPSGVLRRGSGGGYDRATVFVALLRQLDVDAFLVGPPTANAWPLALKESEPLPEPFWAVGVRDVATILLYDPLRGLPVPGPTPGKPATLAEVKANPDLLKPWATDGQGALPTADEVKASVLFPAVPLSTVSPRLATFQQSAGNDLGMRAAVNWPSVAKAATDAGATVTAWAPPRFSFAPPRALRESLPAADGGTADERRAVAPLFEQMPQFAGLGGGAERGLTEQLFALTRGGYAKTLIEPAPRERLQRGQYADATQLLVRTRDQFARLSERAGDPAAVRAAGEWLAQTNDLYKKLTTARLDANTLDGQAALRSAEEAVQKKWTEKGAVETMIAEVTAEPVLREATYLLALAKHEQAERAQHAVGKGPAEAAAAKAAWTEASGWWQRYLPLAAEHDKSFPGRAAHAKALADRAAALAK